MRRALKYTALVSVTLIIILSCIYLYVIYSINSEIAKHINRSDIKEFIIPIDQKNSHKVSFAKAETYLAFFRSGVKILSLVEEGSGYLIQHSEPLYIYYDILEQKLILSYSGESIAKYKPLESNFGSKIKGKYKLSVDLKLKDVLESINSDEEDESLLGLINSDQIAYEINDLTAFDIADNKQISDQKILNGTLYITKKGHYRSLSEFLSNIPKEYRFVFNLDVSKVPAEKSFLAPSSIIYGFLVPTNISLHGSLSMQTDSKTFDAQEMLKYMILGFKSDFKYNIDNKAKIYFDLKTQINDQNSPSELEDRLFFGFDVNNSCDSCTNALLTDVETYAELLKSISYKIEEYNKENKENAINVDSARVAYLTSMAKFLRSLVKYDQTILDKISLTGNLSYSKNNQGTQIEVDNINLLLQQSGVQITSSISGNEQDQHFTGKGKISILNHNKILEAISEYVAPSVLVQIDQNDAQEIIFNSILNGLKVISDYPDSVNDKEIIIGYEIDTKTQNQAKIGMLDLLEAANKVTNIFYSEVFKYCLKFSDPIAKLKHIFPNIAKEHPTILKNFEDSYKAIQEMEKAEANKKLKE